MTVTVYLLLVDLPGRGNVAARIMRKDDSSFICFSSSNFNLEIGGAEVYKTAVIFSHNH